MTRATQEQLLNRRRDMLRYDRLGIKPKDWIPLVASKHHTTEETVKRDWSKRKTWIRLFLKVDDAEALALDILFDYEVAILDAYTLYEQAEEVKIKIQTLWLRLKTILLKANYLRELGALEYVKSDYLEKVGEHKEEMLENKLPYLKGNRDREIRRRALSKK